MRGAAGGARGKDVTAPVLMSVPSPLEGEGIRVYTYGSAACDKTGLDGEGRLPSFEMTRAKEPAMSETASPYDIGTEILFGAGEHMDVAAVGAAQTPWWNRTLCAVNDTWVRLGVLEGDFHWHKHEEEDEFFFVLEGRLDIELEDRIVTLEPMQGFTVPKGVMHLPHARGRVVVMMVEKAGVVPTGD